jgi:hypothetical protein
MCLVDRIRWLRPLVSRKLGHRHPRAASPNPSPWIKRVDVPDDRRTPLVRRNVRGAIRFSAWHNLLAGSFTTTLWRMSGTGSEITFPERCRLAPLLLPATDKMKRRAPCVRTRSRISRSSGRTSTVSRSLTRREERISSELITSTAWIERFASPAVRDSLAVERFGTPSNKKRVGRSDVQSASELRRRREERIRGTTVKSAETLRWSWRGERNRCRAKND